MVLSSESKRFIIPDLPSADEVLPYLREIDKNHWYSNFGPLVGSFETLFARAMGQVHGTAAKNCVAMASGTHALSIGLRLLGIGPQKRVLVPSVTFPACPLAAQNLGADIIFSDIDPDKWVLTPDIAFQIVQKIKIDAVMPVSIYGIPLPASEWDHFIQKTGIPVIIDAAAAIESQRYPQKALVAHSLHALKPFGIGEGGLLVLPEEKMAATARELINFGMVNRVCYLGGENAKMSEYHAAIALAQLKRWPEIKMRRRAIYEMYLTALKSMEKIVKPHEELENTIVSAFMIRIKNHDATATLSQLIAKGVAAHRTYLPPLYEHPHFASLPLATAQGQRTKKREKMKGAQAMNASVLGLPFHAFLSKEDIFRVTETLNAVLKG